MVEQEISEADAEIDYSPMQPLTEDDVEEYVAESEFIDIAFGRQSVVFVFKRRDGKLIGIKAEDRSSLKTCAVETVSDSAE